MNKRACGFVTIATGRTEFFIMARNLLRSYRFFSKTPLPFAIICDKVNKYTYSFDDVVLVSDAKRSYLDKLALTSLAPYDKTIFIDADCIAYRDLNDLWDVFKNAPPFNCLGLALPFDADYGWFKREDVGIFRDKVKFHITFHGGAYYIERSNPALSAFSETVAYVNEHYQEYKFRFFPRACDEPVFSLAMAVHGFAPVAAHEKYICFLPMVKSVRADIKVGALSYEWPLIPGGKYENVYLLHWGHHKFFWLFLRQSFVLIAVSKGRSSAFNDVVKLFGLVLIHSIRRFALHLFPYWLKRAVFRIIHPSPKNY